MKPLSRLACAALLVSAIAPARATEIMTWERLPLAVPLRVGEERVVFVERNVRVGVPASVGDRLRVQSAAGAVYLTANAPIEPTRLQLQDAESGQTFLIDIAAEAPAKAGGKPLEPVKIVAQDTPPPAPAGKARRRAAGRKEATPGNVPVPVALARYAAQSLYAPLRTVEPLPGVSRVSLPEGLDFSTLLPGEPVAAHAIAAWRLADYRITAVRLSNQSATVIQLHPTRLQGAFAAAAFQHGTLGVQGTPEDTTVVYLVTHRRDIAGALLPAIRPYGKGAEK